MGRIWGSALLTGALVVTTGSLVAVAPAASAADGLFGAYQTFAPGEDAANVAIGDLTGDGRADVVVTTDYSQDPAIENHLWVYPQRTDGTLGSPTSYATGAAYGSAMAVALADLDEDGDLDVAVTTKGGVQIFEQSLDGLAYTWTVPIEQGRDLELADVSGDGLADLVVNTDAGIEVWWQIYGDFMWAPTGRMLSGQSAVEIEVADVTGDGLNDVVSAEGGTIAVRAQKADHSFAAPVSYASGGVDPWDRVNGLAVGDTNGDGLADVHVSVGGNKPNSWVITRFQLSDGTLAKPYVRQSYDVPETLEVADVTGDGRGDLVVLHGGWNSMGVYDSTPGTNEVESLYPLPYASHYDAKALAIGDVSGDGRADVAVAEYNHGLVQLLGVAPASTMPDTTITGGPSGTIRSTSATFVFSAKPTPAYFQCSMDFAAWVQCPPQATYTGLETGTSHTFRVRAVGTNGAVEDTPATRVFAVDSAADLNVTLTADQDPVERGGTLTYTSRLSNAGPDAATDVVLTQALPSGFQLDSVSAALDAPVDVTVSCTGGAEVRCTMPTFGRGDWLIVTVTGTVTARKGSLDSSVSVGSSTWELATGNDTASVSTSIGRSGGKGSGNGGGKDH
jgi:uncharacterized repeat protein (TIGR01451 family)